MGFAKLLYCQQEKFIGTKKIMWSSKRKKGTSDNTCITRVRENIQVPDIKHVGLFRLKITNALPILYQ